MILVLQHDLSQISNTLFFLGTHCFYLIKGIVQANTVSHLANYLEPIFLCKNKNNYMNIQVQ